MPNSNNAYIPRSQSSSGNSNNNSSVKIATPDLLIDDGTLSLESMTDFVFADIGGQELLSTTRHDLVDSPFVENNTIRDAGSLFRRTKYIEPNDGIVNNFASFPTEINDYIPTSITEAIRSSGFNLSEVDVIDNIYVEKDSGAVFIVFKNLKSFYKIEISFVSIDDLINGTIY